MLAWTVDSDRLQAQVAGIQPSLNAEVLFGIVQSMSANAARTPATKRRSGGIRESQGRQGADPELLAWVERETARRSREENPDHPAQLRPLEDFNDEYADTSKYRSVNQKRTGRESGTLAGLVIGDCCGWPEPPSSKEVYEAMRAERPTDRQESMIDVVLRAEFETLFSAWMEGAFTWRQVARAVRERTWLEPEQIRAINTTASS